VVWVPQYRRIAIKLVAAGQAPTREGAQSATRQMIATKKQAAEQRFAEVAAFVAESGPHAAAWVRGTTEHPRPRPAVVRERLCPGRGREII
jgi:hypothetical protein